MSELSEIHIFYLTLCSFHQVLYHNLPKFASGAIAYGPTMGLFGEYSGAQNNPEVVAPLNKLRNLIQPTGGMGGVVEFRIDGRMLRGVLNKVDRYNQRTR